MFTNYPPYAQWETKTGRPDELGGIGYAMGQEVCKQCNMDCEFIVDKWANCWSDDLPGVGLQAGYYDGCMTYTAQYQRKWSLEFSNAFLQKNKPAGILTSLKPDGMPTIHPYSDLSGYRICDVAGWAPTIKTLSYSENDCAGHQLFRDYTVVTPPENGPDSAMKLLLNGECDAVYMYADMIETRKTCNGCTWDAELYTHLGTKYAWIHTGVMEHMANGTTLTMSRKGSGVPAIVNPCIQKALKTKAYYDMCEKFHLVQECYPNEYFPEGTESHAYSQSNIERDAACSVEGDSDHIHDTCGCQTGYCGCDLSHTQVPGHAEVPAPARLTREATHD